MLPLGNHLMQLSIEKCDTNHNTCGWCLDVGVVLQPPYHFLWSIHQNFIIEIGNSCKLTIHLTSKVHSKAWLAFLCVFAQADNHQGVSFNIKMFKRTIKIQEKIAWFACVCDQVHNNKNNLNEGSSWGPKIFKIR